MSMKGRSRVGRNRSLPSLDALLGQDEFRVIRDDPALARLERRIRSVESKPYQYLLNALLGVGTATSERRAKAIWESIKQHRRALNIRADRLFALRTAAIDWLYLQDELERPFRAIVVSKETLSAVIEGERKDPLTALPRRAHFEEALTRELARRPFVGGSVVFFDLDGFKRANDTKGHAFGDKLLRTRDGAP